MIAGVIVCSLLVLIGVPFAIAGERVVDALHSHVWAPDLCGWFCRVCGATRDN